MGTTQLNMHEAKTHLSRLIARLRGGDRLIICNRHRPVAEVRPISRPGSRPRRLGVARGEFKVPQAFFEPLPEAFVEAFGG